MNTPDVSLVIPISTRHDDVATIVAQLKEGIRSTGKTLETVVAVDGELPEQLELARDLAQGDPDMHLIRFARRFGEGAAFRAGFEVCRAPIVVSHPAYYQADLVIVPDMLKAIDDGADLAFASRLASTDSLFNRFQRACFNRLVRWTVGTKYRDLACSLRAMRREMLDGISTHGAFHRFLTVAAIMSGYQVREIDTPLHPLARRARPYGPLTYLHRLLDIANVFFLTRFIHKPLRFFGVVGVLLFVPGVLICAYLSILRIVANQPLGGRPMFLFGVILSVLGFQILGIGLLGEIISFAHATRNKAYSIREVVRKEATASTSETPSSSGERGS